MSSRDEQADERPAEASLMRCLRVVSLLVFDRGRLEVGQLGARGSPRVILLDTLTAPNAVGGIGCSEAAPSTTTSSVPPDSTTSATITVMLSIPPSVESRGDQALSSIVQVRQLQSGLDLVVVDQPAYAVAAEHQPITGHDRHHGEVGVVGGLPVQHLQQQRAVRVHRGFGFADLAVVDQGLHPAVIVREPFQLAVAEQVGAAVSDVRQAELECRRTWPR